MLEIAKVDVLLAEKELSSTLTRMIYSVLIKPCVITVSKISEMAEWYVTIFNKILYYFSKHFEKFL